MANKISWVMEMIDKVSGPSKTASSSLGDFIQTTHSALAAVQLIGQAAIGAGRMIASGLQPAISREKSLGAFETLLGTAKQARDMYGQAVKFAAETPFETAQVVDSFQRLLTARFSEEEVPIAMRIIGDAASMQEDSQAAVQSVTRALSQIRSKGKLQGEELMQLQEAVPINSAQLYEKLGKIYGTNADAARKMQEAGQIDSQAASFAILEQLSEQFGGNMERASKQVGGLLSTLQSRPAEFLAKLQDTKGYDALREVLAKMAGAFDPETSGLTPFLTQLGSGVLERASVMLEYLSEGASAFMEGLAAGIGPLDTAFGPANQANLTTFRELLGGMGAGIGAVANSVGFFVDQLAGVLNYLTQIGQWWTQNETLAGFLDEYIAPLTSGPQTTGTRAGTTQELLVAQKRQHDRRVALEQQAGAAEPDIVAVPAFASGAIVHRPTLALVGERGPELIQPLSGNYDRLPTGRGGSAPIINASFVFNGVAATQEGAQDIRREVEAGILATLERWALQSGRYA